MANELMIVDKYCNISKTSLTFKRDVTKAEWQNVFDACRNIEGCVQFWLGDLLKYREQKWKMYDDVAEETGYDKETLRKYKQIAGQVESGVRTPTLGFQHHQIVAPLEPEEQKEWLGKASREKMTVKDLRSAIKESKRLPDPAMPKGKFPVIYADPPWQFANAGFSESADSHYPTMPTEEICEMDIPAHSKSVLFLWACNAMLLDALEVCDAWGFNYKSNFVWAKNKGPSIGWFTKSRHEILLICTKGDGVHPVKKFPSWFEADVSKHSKKPLKTYAMIEQMYEGPYLELFARETKKGWSSYGNEI